MNKSPSKDRALLTGLRVRSGLKAGNLVCFDDSSGYLVPVDIGSYYPYIPPFEPGQYPQPTGSWLSCQQCSGTKVGANKLYNAKCEVCG